MPGQILAKPSPDFAPFDLDFSGGTPLELVKAIEKALGTNVNVFIPTEHANYRLPPFRVNQVSVFTLFNTMRQLSNKYVQVRGPSTTGGPIQNYQVPVGYGFTSDTQLIGRYLWRFQVTEAPPELEPLKSCKFFQLAPYLQNNLRVEDITTAITTGWDLMGLKKQPEMQYHKETKMLIAFGEAAHLEVIASVLKELQPPPEKVPAPKSNAPPEKK